MRKIKRGGAPEKPAAGKIHVKNNFTLECKAFSPPRRAPKIFGLFVLFALILPNFGCESPSLKANSAKSAAANAQNNLSSFESDLQSMRTANFDFIYVFRRKDGGALDGEDKRYLKANTPAATNRFILTDENKAVIAGSSYKFEPENLENLQKRFSVENFSKPESQTAPANQNVNR